ncbi:VWA domain-containing protein [Lacisediminimonas sp.]|uniref:vWA domain-containing protein n=1 Tax=Lacisediminimonas sp. TaxID=3060582 RepID=UPI00271D5CC4|nr:VWA domain-containing protein [Lacisediminimonas sp.]MDO8299230.1 VWA domain-containing protein [Lacisediminimonas sp.]
MPAAGDQGPGPAPAATAPGTLAENVVRFVRVLRHAGLPLGPDKVIDALRAVEVVGLDRRDDFRATLNTVLVNRHEHQFIFEQAFQLFWRDPARGAQQLQALLAQLGGGLRKPDSTQVPVSPRLAHALWPGALRPPQDSPDLPPEMELDASLTLSAQELLQTRDFAAMTPAELAQAKKLLAGMRLQFPGIVTRRYRARSHGGRIDLRNTLRQMMKSGAGLLDLRYRAIRKRPPAIVILCDISGSMESYTRMLLHFIHAVSNDRSRVQSFLFGTRLSNITRALRGRDVDVALDKVAGAVQDWAGGTRIAACLHDFNQRWGRRLLGQGAVVLLITDGLDSDNAVQLGLEMARLRRSCNSLVWLNPLLRYPGFEARPAGIRAMLPHVDRFVPVHNLQSLMQLGAVMDQSGSRSDLRSR